LIKLGLLGSVKKPLGIGSPEVNSYGKRLGRCRPTRLTTPEPPAVAVWGSIVSTTKGSQLSLHEIDGRHHDRDDWVTQKRAATCLQKRSTSSDRFRGFSHTTRSFPDGPIVRCRVFRKWQNLQCPSALRYQRASQSQTRRESNIED
jgi:hypothetical protein